MMIINDVDDVDDVDDDDDMIDGYYDDYKLHL